MSYPSRFPFLGLAAVIAVVGLALALSTYVQSANDLGWHLAAGKWIVANHRAPTADFFSFTRQGLEWLDAQWLFQVLGYAFLGLGEPGVTILNLLLAVAVLVVLLLAVPGKTPLGLRALAGFLFLLAINPRLILRPEMLSCLYMAAMFFSLERARQGRTNFLIAVVVIQLLWTNSEGIWPIGIGIMGAYLADRVFENWRAPGFSWRRPVNGWWPAALLAGVLLGFLQPYGLKGFLFPFILLREISFSTTVHKQLIVEIQPVFSWPFYPGSVIPFLVFAAVALVTTVAAGKRLRPFLLLLVLYFLYSALNARRNVSLGSVMLGQLLFVHLELLVAKWPRTLLAKKLATVAAIAAIVGAVGFAALSLSEPIRTWDSTGREVGFGLSRRSNPAAACDFLQAIGYRGRIINDEGIGGYLIYRGWPDWQVSADSRMEVGGEAALIFNLQVESDPAAFRAVAAKYQVDAVMVHHLLPHLRVFAVTVAQDPDWALCYLDWATAVFLRRTPQLQPIIAEKEIPLETILQKLRKK